MIAKFIEYNNEIWYLSDKYTVEDYRYTFDITNRRVSYKCDVFYSNSLYADELKYKIQQIHQYECQHNM